MLFSAVTAASFAFPCVDCCINLIAHLLVLSNLLASLSAEPIIGKCPNIAPTVFPNVSNAFPTNVGSNVPAAVILVPTNVLAFAPSSNISFTFFISLVMLVNGILKPSPVPNSFIPFCRAV